SVLIIGVWLLLVCWPSPLQRRAATIVRTTMGATAAPPRRELAVAAAAAAPVAPAARQAPRAAGARAAQRAARVRLAASVRAGPRVRLAQPVRQGPRVRLAQPVRRVPRARPALATAALIEARGGWLLRGVRSPHPATEAGRRQTGRARRLNEALALRPSTDRMPGAWATSTWLHDPCSGSVVSPFVWFGSSPGVNAITSREPPGAARRV